ncbi:MAG: DMT family transporter [Anaerolineaceae bacterium]|nr:DMT family transporter [Anaerolineaceae bacterium]
MDLTAVIYGLLAAVCWGAGDFSGGFASRKSGAFSVVIVSQVIGLAALLLLALTVEDGILTAENIVWGGLAGLFGGLGLVALYRGLAQGHMGTVAPVTAVVTVIVPMIAGMLGEGFPGAQPAVGFGCALVAVWLVSRSEHGKIRLGDLGLPIVAGLGFGMFMTLMDRAGETSALLPLIPARLASITLLFGIATFTRRPIRPNRGQFPVILLAGLLDAGGTAFFVLAAQAGRLDIAAVVSSLYPAGTVFLAWGILKERIQRQQWVGVAFALLAVVLITSG